MSQIQFIIYFHVHISFYSPNIFNNETNSTVLSFLHHILFNSSMYSKVQQSQWSFLGLHSHLFQQSQLFKSVTNSVVLSTFTIISQSTVPHIQQCHKFSLLSTFTFISHSTVPTYSTMKQIRQSYLFYIISYSTVPCIQKCNKVNGLFLVYILISFNSRNYSKVSQIQLYYLLSLSYLNQQSKQYSTMQQIQYSNLFYIISYSTVQCIQKCNKVNCLISFYILISFNSRTYSTVSQIQLHYLISHSYLIQQSQIFDSVTNSVV